jgi:phenylpropionate dioxygenase-like ring-hydroxylating dioxygenase large terminal subunit
VRGTDGTDRAVLNTCRHRGNRVCRADVGKAASFTLCLPRLDLWQQRQIDGRAVPRGRLLQRAEDGRSGASFRSRKSIVTTACTFGTFDAARPPLKEYLGETAWYLDNFFQRNEGGIEIIGGAHKWVLPCNWKYAAENFSGDAYHVQTSHLSGVTIGFDTAPTAQR